MNLTTDYLFCYIFTSVFRVLKDRPLVSNTGVTNNDVIVLYFQTNSINYFQINSIFFLLLYFLKQKLIYLLHRKEIRTTILCNLFLCTSPWTFCVNAIKNTWHIFLPHSQICFLLTQCFTISQSYKIKF